MKRLGKFLAYAAVVIAAAWFVNHNAAQEAQTNYANQIASCRSGNPVRIAVVLAIRTAAENATSGNARYSEAVQKIISAPHVRPNGSKECRKAVIHP